MVKALTKLTKVTKNPLATNAPSGIFVVAVNALTKYVQNREEGTVELANDCQVKIQAGIAKKIGRPNYSSYDAALSVTIVTNIQAVTDDRFGELVSSIYDKIQVAVDNRIAYECRNDNAPAMAAKVPVNQMAGTQPVRPPASQPAHQQNTVPFQPPVNQPVNQPVNHQFVQPTNQPAPVPQSAPDLPEKVFGYFRDFLSDYATQLGIQPNDIVNYLYRKICNGSLPNDQWQLQGKALASHWDSLGSVGATQFFVKTFEDYVPF